jgi:RNA polymerase sigma-70 factor, ECF subfamily
MAVLLDELGGPAYSLALRVTRNSQLAEEAVQDAFLEIWRTAHSFNPLVGSVAAWALGYVRKKAIDRVRHEQRRKPRIADGSAAAAVDVSSVEIKDERGDPFAVAWAASQSAEVRRALAELSSEHRQVLELAYFAGLSQTEIALTTGIAVGTVKTRTLRALSRLRDLLDAPSQEGQPR